MIYQIVQQTAGREFIPAFNKRTKRPMIYPDPKKGALVAARLTRMMGIKYQLRPIVEEGNVWRKREQQRFTDGTYKPVEWSCAKLIADRYPDHFIHVGLKNKAQIAFTRDAQDGAADIQTSMKPGKYLAEFFSDVLTTEQIRDYVMEHCNNYEDRELKFETTPEGIERVYKTEGLGSCFSGTTRANLYGSGDFAVAYIEGPDGSTKARAICCPDRKIYARAYGDTVRLEKLLKDAGYKSTQYESEKWRGLKLVANYYWSGFYTDFGCRVEKSKENPEFYVLV